MDTDQLTKEQAKKWEVCKLFLEQERDKAIAEGKTAYKASNEVVNWIKDRWGVSLKPKTVAKQIERQRKRLATPVGRTKNSSDDFQTPVSALFPLLPYLHKDWIIWECACGNKNLVNEVKRLGYKVFGTDIQEGYDFLEYELTNYDCIITNPPYSLKNEFIARCYELGKPFALLMPLTTLQGKERQPLYKKYGIQLITFDTNVNFETPTGKKSVCLFPTAWFTNGLNLPKNIMVGDVHKTVEKSKVDQPAETPKAWETKMQELWNGKDGGPAKQISFLKWVYKEWHLKNEICTNTLCPNRHPGNVENFKTKLEEQKRR